MNSCGEDPGGIVPELLHPVYQEIGERLGVEVAMEVYRLFKGQQITFPMHFYNPACVRRRIAAEYDGTNLKKLAARYGYSEKTIRRMVYKNTKPEGDD